MPYENYKTVEEFHENCHFWGIIEQELRRRFQPNPWLFESGYRLFPQTQEFCFIYRNFDGSKHLCFDFSYHNGQSIFRFPPSPR